MLAGDNNVDVCGFCNAPATKKCSQCRQISYCSKEHQKEHWKIHKINCRPFSISKSDTKGRFLSAARDLEINEVVLKDEPLIIGPKFASPRPACLGCLKPIVSISCSPKCTSCRWPLCNAECKGIEANHKLECQLLTAGNKKGKKTYKYEIITPLRCLLQKKHNPQKWAVISDMEAHLKHRAAGTEIYKEVDALYSYFEEHVLRNSSANDSVSKDEFHRVCGILEVNSLDVPHESIDLSALYPIFSNIEHSCLPNVKISFNKFKVVVKAIKSISRNESLSTAYTNLLWGTQIRQQHLWNAKYFLCSCVRCQDPTELGTNFSSIKCLQDNCRGFLMLEKPLVVDSAWKCSQCNTIMPSEDVNEIVSRLNFEVEQILEQKVPKLEEVEGLLQKLLSVLHSSHYNCFSIKHTLIQLYGHQIGYQQLNNELLKKKTEYCRELIFILSRLDNGGSRVPLYIATTNYELSAAMLEIMRRTLLETMNLSLIQEDGKEAKRLLTKSVTLLNDEKSIDMSLQLIKSCKSLYKEIEDTLNGNCFTDF